MGKEKQKFLEELIREQEERIKNIKIEQNELGFKRYYYLDMSRYAEWVENAKRYLNTNYPGDKQCEAFEKKSEKGISIKGQNELLAILKALLRFPDPLPASSMANKKESQVLNPINVTTNISNSNSQTQNQQQSIAIKLFLEAIKDDLTGRQIKELKEIVSKADNNLSKARPAIIEKLKSFGSDVLSNCKISIK